MGFVEMVVLLFASALISQRVVPRRAVLLAAHVSRLLWGRRAKGSDVHVGERGQRMAYDATRLIRWADCMDRAMATRIWLARRGVSSRIIVGFRKKVNWEGHAWLEVEDGEVCLFHEEHWGYREVFREGDPG